ALPQGYGLHLLKRKGRGGVLIDVLLEDALRTGPSGDGTQTAPRSNGLGRVRQPVGPRPVGSDSGGLGAATGVFLVVHRRGAGPGAGPPEAVRVATSRTDRGHWCRAAS